MRCSISKVRSRAKPRPGGVHQQSAPLPPLLVLVSLAVLLKASGWFTAAAERIGYGCGLPGFLVGLTIVALGISLPEVAVTIAAARRGRPELAVGNVLGANVFNAFAVTGASALIGPLRVPDSLLEFALPLMLIATLLGFFMIMEKEMTKWKGWLALLFYVFFLGTLLGLL